MSIPEEAVMNLYDLHLKKKFLICLRGEVDVKINVIDRYIASKEEKLIQESKTKNEGDHKCNC